MKIFLALFLLIPNLSSGLDKDELREELKYWKSLLDDNLISLEDYNQKKSELLSSKNNLKINVNPESLKSPEKTGNKSNDYELSLNEVKGVQLALKRLGWDISIDGIFGNQTQIALNDWLECNNLQSNNKKGNISYLLITTQTCTNYEIPSSSIYKKTPNISVTNYEAKNIFFIKDEKYLKNKNDSYSGIITKVDIGTTFKILEKTDDRKYKIVLNDGTIGYMDEWELNSKSFKVNATQSSDSKNLKVAEIKSDEKIEEITVLSNVNLPSTSYGCTNIENTRFPIYTLC